MARKDGRKDGQEGWLEGWPKRMTGRMGRKGGQEVCSRRVDRKGGHEGWMDRKGGQERRTGRVDRKGRNSVRSGLQHGHGQGCDWRWTVGFESRGTWLCECTASRLL